MKESYKFSTIIRVAKKENMHIIFNAKTTESIYLDEISYIILEHLQNNFTVDKEDLIKCVEKYNIVKEDIFKLIIFLEENNFIEAV